MPPEFGADLLPEDFEAVETQWERALERVPTLGEVGIKANTRGPFQMTPPDELPPLAGPAPGGHDNLWLAEGMPGGILWGGHGRQPSGAMDCKRGGSGHGYVRT